MLRRACGFVLVMLLTQQWTPAIVCGLHCAAGVTSSARSGAMAMSAMPGMDMDAPAVTRHDAPPEPVAACAQQSPVCCSHAAFLPGSKTVREALRSPAGGAAALLTRGTLVQPRVSPGAVLLRSAPRLPTLSPPPPLRV